MVRIEVLQTGHRWRRRAHSPSWLNHSVCYISKGNKFVTLGLYVECRQWIGPAEGNAAILPGQGELETVTKLKTKIQFASLDSMPHRHVRDSNPIFSTMSNDFTSWISYHKKKKSTLLTTKNKFQINLQALEAEVAGEFFFSFYSDY
jgi:hypothetical protein